MNNELKQELINLAKENVDSLDSAHDFNHSMRVLNNVLKINEGENADEEIIFASALFHDLVNLPKGKFYSKHSAELSAIHAGELLEKTAFPKDKISDVKLCIKEHSSSAGKVPSTKESAILQDADRLEAVGAIIVMRSSASTALMNRKLCSLEEPSTLDYIEAQLNKVKFNTRNGNKLGLPRLKFQKLFLDQIRSEIV